MRVLHTAFTLKPAHGMLNQMRWEQSAAREHRLDWSTKLFCPPSGSVETDDILVPARTVVSPDANNPRRRAGDWYRLRHEYYQWLTNAADDYDVILLRYSPYNPLQTAFARKLRTPFYLVHHTLEVPELHNSNRAVTNSIQVKLENVFGKMTLKSAHGLIGVTGEILDYEKGRIHDQGKTGYVYPNGIYYDTNLDPTAADERVAVPEVLFVANHFSYWHGLDLVLDSLAGADSDFILHLVGSLNAEDHARAKRDPRIRLHGVLKTADINRLSRRCWIGLSSFALDRKKMQQACTLKVREYLRNGLPVYAGHRDVFPDDFAYYRMGPADIEKIVEYAWSVRMVARKEVADRAKPFVSKAALVKGLHDWLQASHG